MYTFIKGEKGFLRSDFHVHVTLPSANVKAKIFILFFVCDFTQTIAIVYVRAKKKNTERVNEISVRHEDNSHGNGK